jgi:homoserine dehydrogenase
MVTMNKDLATIHGQKLIAVMKEQKGCFYYEKEFESGIPIFGILSYSLY